MDLSNRLFKIASLVDKNTSVLDIGTDHGYIPIYLIEENISDRVIASDISKASLNKIIELVKKRKLEKYISTRLGNGMEVIKPFEVDGVIMAGMGGILMKDILEKDKEVTDSITYFIFQPMIASKELREYLSENNFKIIDEELAKEGDKFYEIIYAKRGKEEHKEKIYYEISEILIEKRHRYLKDFIHHKIKLVEIVLDKIKDKNTSKSIERYNELNKKIEKYKEVMKEIES